MQRVRVNKAPHEIPESCLLSNQKKIAMSLRFNGLYYLPKQNTMSLRFHDFSAYCLVKLSLGVHRAPWVFLRESTETVRPARCKTHQLLQSKFLFAPVRRCFGSVGIHGVPNGVSWGQPRALPCAIECMRLKRGISGRACQK